MTLRIPQDENPLDGGATGVFTVELGDEAFRFRRVPFDDRKVVGAQIAAAAGAHPIEEFVILHHLTSGELESIRPTESLDLREEGVKRFFVVRGDDLHRFTVEGLSMEWPKGKLAAKHIKFLAKASEDRVLVLDSAEGDIVLDDDDLVDLSANGVERLLLRRLPKMVTVYYKEAPFELERGIYTTEQLVAVFSAPAGYLLDLIERDGEFRELKAGERIKIREGLEFSSHPPAGHSS
ncbi:multiubiquitin domain-containing protein [Roseiarcaceae bacterium H3SJ34-1]|uniref:multiubiquitin domain-containing protein n=1 Tax=Terripilifer ovatus TaxID=3032367 RepID=UPI003AB93E23|nr:multiubiquitin domain-containing protein [Roseiarcaceae bacterium H3SJ34-1]